LCGLEILFEFIELLILRVHGQLVDLPRAHKVDLVSHVVDGIQERLEGFLDVAFFLRRGRRGYIRESLFRCCPTRRMPPERSV